MKKFMIAALAAGMLTACSDSAVVETPAGGGAQWGADGTGYVSLSINLPKTTSAGRANDNDQFEDGLPSEYAVNDAVLLLFKGAGGEASSTFQGAYKLPVHFASGDPDQITSTANITKRIKAITTGVSDEIYAFVMLNAITNNIFTLTNTDKVEDYTWSDAKIKTTTGDQALTENSTTFANVQDMISALPTSINNGLIMVNAPLSNVGSQNGVAPSGGKVTILSTVDKGCIQTSAAAAASKPAAKVYVERSTAKVTLTGTDKLSGDIANALLSEGGAKLKYQVLGIALDNYNKNSYLVRNVSGYNDWYTLTSNKSLSPLATMYRFVGNSAVDGKYRIYWAKDENYNSEGGALQTDTITSPLVASVHEFIDISALGVDQVSKAMYCNENVFDVEHMKWDNTTRAIIKVHLGTPGDNDDYIMWNDDSKTYKEYASATGTNGAMAKEIVGLAAFRSVYGDSFDAARVTVSIAPTGILPNTYVVEKVTIDNGTPVELTSSSMGDQLTVFNAVKSYFGTINYFAKGIAYYQVLIQHFGNDLTPWNVGEATPAPTSGGIDETYPSANRNANYLGRYGVLRNNWYNLTINGVNAIGTPYIPNVKSTENKDNPDDQLKSYISVEINILSWAKRDQGVILE
ncbi:MAG: fimbria major subunit [Alloprevotella sp.]|nr:fimbria major subunit [Bacteroidales bacterium]MDY2975299.1 fimbria major subunit [Alloprevotella sp.]MDY5769426.1 fimbria major subunit [Alloprevotella sp.]